MPPPKAILSCVHKENVPLISLVPGVVPARLPPPCAVCRSQISSLLCIQETRATSWVPGLVPDLVKCAAPRSNSLLCTQGARATSWVFGVVPARFPHFALRATRRSGSLLCTQGARATSWVSEIVSPTLRCVPPHLL